MGKKIEMVGKRFGRLTVIREAGKVRGEYTWLCQCDCGNQTVVLGWPLRSGRTKSCGCYLKDFAKGQTWRREDLTGRRFGRLTVLSLAGKSKAGNLRWHCLCDCGNTVDVEAGNLKRDYFHSCGCYNKEFLQGLTKTHGGTKDKLFRIWSYMKERCLNPHHKSWKRYGGRGIKVCDEWVSDYESFKNFALANGWREGLQIDRIDNDGNYEPNNVAFITPKENANKRGNNVYVEIRGCRMTVAEAARKYGLCYQVVWNRYRAGKTGEDLLR